MIFAVSNNLTNSVTKKIPPLKPILAYPNKAIDRLCLQINQQSAILGRIRAVLPNDLAGHALHCVLNDKKLVVYTDSANWATQLRFYGATILAEIGAATSKLVPEIQVKILHARGIAAIPSNRGVLIPSQHVRDEIRSQSLAATDPRLKQALNKLCSTLDRLQPRKSLDSKRQS